jgi:hypothetical protein
MGLVRTSLVWVLLLAAPLMPGLLLAQSVHVTARVDSNNILIGDWLPLHIEVTHPANTTVTFPSLPDSIEGFEVIRRDPPTKKTTGDGVLEISTFVLTAFDSGMHVVPPLTVRYTTAGDTTTRAMDTPPVPIVVHGIAVDTAQEIKDVKPPLSLPLTLADLLPYLIGAAVLAGLVWLYRYIRARRRKGMPLIPEAPPRPANELALEALRSLESERMWQRGKVKEYHSLLADIIRLYIEKRFAVDALESTSDEVLTSEPIKLLPADDRDRLKEILTRADLVKFAKFQPQPEEHEKSLRLAISFVESTWNPVQQPVGRETPEEVNLPAS